MTKYYLKGTSHYIETPEKARAVAKRFSPAVVREESDGTYSTYELDEKPLQPGQTQFIIRDGEEVI